MRADRIGANFGVPPFRARKLPKMGQIRDLTSPRLCRWPGNGPKRAGSGISAPPASVEGPETARNGPDSGSHLPSPLLGPRNRPKTGRIRDLTSPLFRQGARKRPKTGQILDLTSPCLVLDQA